MRRSSSKRRQRGQRGSAQVAELDELALERHVMLLDDDGGGGDPESSSSSVSNTKDTLTDGQAVGNRNPNAATGQICENASFRFGLFL